MAWAWVDGRPGEGNGTGRERRPLRTLSWPDKRGRGRPCSILGGIDSGRRRRQLQKFNVADLRHGHSCAMANRRHKSKEDGLRCVPVNRGVVLLIATDGDE